VSLLVDTNVCIAYLNGREPGIRARLLSQSPDRVFLCAVVRAELLYGARKSTRVEANLSRLAEFLRPFPTLPFDDQAAEWYGIIRAQLEVGGTPIGANDLLIAAIARAHDATVVTRNRGEFERVAGLRVEAW